MLPQLGVGGGGHSGPQVEEKLEAACFRNSMWLVAELLRRVARLS